MNAGGLTHLFLCFGRLRKKNQMSKLMWKLTTVRRYPPPLLIMCRDKIFKQTDTDYQKEFRRSQDLNNTTK